MFIESNKNLADCYIQTNTSHSDKNVKIESDRYMICVGPAVVVIFGTNLLISSHQHPHYAGVVSTKSFSFNTN